MGSPLSPILANLYMEYFEEIALKSTEIVQSLMSTFLSSGHMAKMFYPIFLSISTASVLPFNLQWRRS